MYKYVLLICFLIDNTYTRDEPKIFLNLIDENIMKILENPDNSKIWSLMKYLNNYNKNFASMFGDCKQKNKYDTYSVLSHVYKAGGPTFLNFTLNYDILRKEHGWSEIETLDLRNLISDTWVLWQNFKMFVERRTVSE